jgi:hypothetical protein
MTANIAFNWMQTTTAPGTFTIESTGYVQGEMLDDPAVRYQLAGGVLATTETLPMWPGVAINETVLPNTGANPPDATQGGLITRATNVTGNAAGQITGFSVFNQAYGMTITPQSPVPLAASGMQVNFIRLRTNARVAVACAPSLVSLSGGTTTQQVSWDFDNQMLIPFVAAWAGESVASATYNSTSGILSLTFSTAPFGAGVGATNDGVFITVGGLAGTGAVASLNGNFPIVSTGTAGTVINVQAPAGLGTIAITSATGSLAAGGGQLNVQVLEVLVGNSMTVNFSPVTGFATYDRTGSVAVILI